jgi:hypothetical protein
MFRSLIDFFRGLSTPAHDNRVEPQQIGATEVVINPANGQPMVGGMGGVDIEGNPYGTDFTSQGEHDAMSPPDNGFMTLNPANGLPMVDGIGGIDIAGNLYGNDSHSASTYHGFDSGFSSDFGGGFSDFGGGFTDCGGGFDNGW